MTRCALEIRRFEEHHFALFMLTLGNPIRRLAKIHHLKVSFVFKDWISIWQNLKTGRKKLYSINFGSFFIYVL